MSRHRDLPARSFGPALAANLPFGMVMTGFYLWRRDLVANGAAHSLLLLNSMVRL